MIDVVSVSSDTTSGYFSSVGAHMFLMCDCWFSNTLLQAFRALLWMAVQRGSVSINLSLWLFNKLIQKTMSIQFISITISKSKSKAITISSGMGINSWPFPIHLDTPIRGMCPFIIGRILQIGSCGCTPAIRAPSVVVFAGHSCASGRVRVVIMLTGSCCCCRNLSWIRA